jgi:peroxiredoxin
MRRNVLAGVLAVLVCATHALAEGDPNAAAVGRQVPAFTAKLLTVKGEKVEEADFDSARTQRPTLYGFIGTTCPVTASYAERLKALAEKYQKSVDVLFVYSSSFEKHEEKLAFHRSHGFAAALVDDRGAMIKQALGAVRSTEMFLADAKGKIVYHGAVDDSAREPEAVKVSYLAQAIDETLAGKPVSIVSSQVFACGIH